jgi:hypothetical protein
MTDKDTTPRDDAIHAYEHTIEMQQPHPHRIDILDEPVHTQRPRRPIRLPSLYRQPPPDGGGHLTHRFEAPTETAFKVGFGFSAGAWSFRAIVTLIIGSGAILLALLLLQSLLGGR